jgi:hypothetical protein
MVFENESEELIFDAPSSWSTTATNGTRHFSEGGT